MSAKLNDEKEKKKISIIFQNVFSSFFKNVNKIKFKYIYFGKKVELINRSNRNYKYQILNLSKRKIAVLPGKFSMAFSLAVEVYKYFNNGKEPIIQKKNITNKDYKIVSNNTHYNKVKEFLERK